MEIDYITQKNQGGGEEISNKCLLHRHCHDDRHARPAEGISDKDHNTGIEPDEGKPSCPVLKPSRGGNSFA
ncbi:HNH endonuclease [Dictyobacter arantiisoli]|uniref:HNH domain-containing protein n=1 Tax=Dictyobacter arantiisoli TaxID=2014874 RepID=A0A5A5TGU1_9CHLR|nr:hypothetical protein KDI_37380 [Dictyobacter arantiisoli]